MRIPIWFSVAVLVIALLIPIPVFAAPGEEKKESRKAAKIGWAVALGSVAAYEVWALKTNHETLSQSVQNSRKMKIAVGIGLSGLAVHLYWK